MNVITISAGLSNPSSTRLLADRLSSAAREMGASVETIELREHARALADNLVTGFASGNLAAAIEEVRRADTLIVVTPVFSASYSGLFKTFFDVLEPGLLTGKPVLLAATAGTTRHSLVLDHALRPLFSYLQAIPVPTGVFAATEDFGDNRAGGLQTRIDQAAGELMAALGSTLGSTLGAPLGAAPTRAPRRTSGDSTQFDDTAADFVDFVTLLADNAQQGATTRSSTRNN